MGSQKTVSRGSFCSQETLPTRDDIRKRGWEFWRLTLQRKTSPQPRPLDRSSSPRLDYTQRGKYHSGRRELQRGFGAIISHSMMTSCDHPRQKLRAFRKAASKSLLASAIVRAGRCAVLAGSEPQRRERMAAWIDVSAKVTQVYPLPKAQIGLVKGCTLSVRRHSVPRLCSPQVCLSLGGTRWGWD
jgi:hypothetical protein